MTVKRKPGERSGQMGAQKVLEGALTKPRGKDKRVGRWEVLSMCRELGTHHGVSPEALLHPLRERCVS